VVATAGAQGPGLLFGLGGNTLSQIAQLLFLTSLFAAALAFHNTVWRYMFALSREGVLPAVLARTGGNNIPRAASLVQSATGLAAISVFALAGWPPVQVMFFWLGTTGGFGVLVLLAVTSAAVVVFFGRDPCGEPVWQRMAAPALAAVLLAAIVVLAVWRYNLLLGVAPGAVAAWALPAAYAAVAALGAGWGMYLKARRPHVYATIGLGAHAITGQHAPATGDSR
jgi:amino acid transporter